VTDDVGACCNFEELDRLFDHIESAVSQNPDDHARHRIAKLQRIVDEARAAGASEPSLSQAALVRQAIETMSSHVQKPLTIVQIAHECGVSPTQLKQTFRKVMGIPVYQWYRAHRIERSCVLLRETNLTIAEIASAVGYANPSKFSIAFHNEKGSMPSEWRGSGTMPSA